MAVKTSEALERDETVEIMNINDSYTQSWLAE
jgi:hypothetical protein